MNAIPMNTTPPGNAVQAAGQAGKQADTGAPDMPFSQVLSGEMAQNRKNDAAKGSSDASAESGPASGPAGAAAGKTDSAQLVKAGVKPTPENGKKDDTASAEDVTAAPETLLALAINPDAFKPAVAPVATQVAGTEAAPTPDAATNVPALGVPEAPVADSRKERAIPLAQAAHLAVDKHGTKAAQRTGEERGAQRSGPRLPGKENLAAADSLHAAAPAGTAAAFQGQLEAARHADAAKTGEGLPEIASNPAMRAETHALTDVRPVPADAASARLAPTVGTTAWGQALGEKLVWMASGTQQTASLTLNPPDLGPLQIVVNVSNDQATASFFSAQPEVRHALESAFPRLREMMNDAGIQLGQATVSADTPRQHDTPDRQAQRIALPFAGVDPAASTAQQAAHAPVRHVGRGLVDTFA